MTHGTSQANARILARYYYRLTRGEEITRDEGQAALRAWTRISMAPWSFISEQPRCQAYRKGVAQNLRDGGFASVCERASNLFDEHGNPLPGADMLPFLREALHAQYHAPHTHHDFFCIRPTFSPASPVNFPIRHPIANDFWSLFVSESGTGQISSGNTELDDLQAGTIAILPSSFHGEIGLAAGHSRWTCIHLAFRPRPHWLDFLKSAFSPSKVTFIHHPAPDIARHVRGTLKELSMISYARGEASEALCFNLIENLLLRLVQIAPSESKAGPNHRAQRKDARIEAAAALVLANSARPLTLHQIAAHAGLSASRLGNLFREQYGMGLIQWRDAIRLDKASQLLSATDSSIAEIAVKVGWEDQFYFSKRFKARFGRSPRSFRKDAANWQFVPRE